MLAWTSRKATHFNMNTQDLPRPVETVLERGLSIRELRVWPEGMIFLDTVPPFDVEDELTQELCRHAPEVLEVQNQMC
jgi:hypothetical protein